MIDEKLTAYRAAGWAIGLVLAYSFLIAVLLIILAEKGKPDWLGVLFSLVVATAVGIPLIALYFKTKIGPEGIKGFDTWGRSRFAHWSKIQRAKPINIGGLRYVRLFVEEVARPLWIPLFHNNQETFEACVRSLAPHGNVLRTFFETNRSEHQG